MRRVGVVTAVAGRHDHLRRQHTALAASTLAPHVVVVVAMGDDGVRPVVDAGRPAARTVVVELADMEEPGARLPLARARNAGAEAAFAHGAELLVFLDVDCLPHAELLERYASAAREHDPALLCGPVAYLAPPPPDADGYDAATLAAAVPHPARPAPPPGVLERTDDVELFWSLSFAVGSEAWRRIGGFDESYTGYGAEDTDLGQRARRAGVPMWWVGGALAYHQWHPVSDPPVEHLHDIVRNANLFAQRWGWVPMQGWLQEFRRLGLADGDDTSWSVRAGA